jgi:hypothetical protein
VAEALVEYVDRETRRAHQPAVLRRANELLGVITRHAYELRVDDARGGSGGTGGGGIGGSSFRAVDRRTGRGHSLEELSSGTRVQLLMAVRLAFVESLEAGVALPLLMDETLANSDDERAAAIMEAVIRLAEAGRQVFYFTAQREEVAKWSEALEGSGVAWKCIDLAGSRALERRIDPAIRRALPMIALPVRLPPEVTHAEIPGLIPIPRLTPETTVSALHPWYLTEDTALLRFLNDLRITSWGVLESLLQESGEPVLEPGVREQFVTSVNAARPVLAGLKIGRGRTVDRATLIESKAVSERYLDELAGLCEELEGDGTRLMAALETPGTVKGFRKNNADTLKTFLEENGYYDTRSPLDFGQLHQRVVAERLEDARTGRLTAAEIDGLIARIARGMGVELMPPPGPEPQMALLL